MNEAWVFVGGFRRIFIFAWVSLVICGTLLSPNAAWGQGGATASITGTVHDASGAVVPGAQVTVIQADTNVSQTTTSTGDGTFVFPILPVGPYRLEVKKESFANYVQTDIVLTVSQAANIPVTLGLAATTQSIEVKATASPVDTTTGTLSNIIDQAEVENLPLNGRNPAELLLYAPGVANIELNSASVAPLPLQFSYPAGVGGSSLSQGALAPVVNGIRAGGIYYSLDGANNTDPYGVTGGPFPNPDAVQEFRVLTSGYGAEYASAPGGVVNIVTKSGTNAFHGNAFEFFRNGIFNARNYFASKRDNIQRNQFGVTAGGPIRKDKLFIFGSYQGTILNQSIGGNIEFVPTDAERAGNFSAIPTQLKNPFTGAPYPGNIIPISDFNSVTSKILAHLPHSTASDGRVEVVRPSPEDEKQITVKADYVLGKHRFLARYLYSNFSEPRQVSDNWLAGNQLGQGLTYRWQDAVVGDTYVSGQWVNELRYTVQRNGYHSISGIQQNIGDLGANITSSANHFMETTVVGNFFNIQSQSSETFPRTTYSASERLHLVRGRHQLSLGAEVSRIQMKETTDNLQSGNTVWGALPPSLPFTSGYQLSDFLLGKATVFIQGDGLLVRAQGTLWGFSATDQIRASSRLSLTLGLRWDPYWPFHTLHGRINCFTPGKQSTVFTSAPLGLLFPGDTGCKASGSNSDLHTFQPRFGFAYNLDKKGNTAIRGGYGMYALQFPMQEFLPYGQTPPYTRAITMMFPQSITNPWLGTPPFSPNYPGGDPFASGFRLNDLPLPSNTAFAPPLSVTAFAKNFKLGNVQKWNLTLEHMFPGSTLVRASYVGDKGTHLSVGSQANAAVYIPGNCGTPPAPCSTAANDNARRPYFANGFQSIALASSNGNSIYHALQLSAERRFATGLTINSNFTWGKAIDDVSTSPNGKGSGPFNNVNDPFDLRHARGLSDFDLSRSFSTLLVWQTPSFAKRDNFFLKQVASHWQVSGIWTWQVGNPFSMYSGIDNSLSGVGLDYADTVPGVSPHLASGRPDSQKVLQYFNKAAFQPNALGTFGNAGRNNILRLPAFNNLDLGIARIFPIKGEKYHLMFRAESFNLTNRPHFAGLQNNLASPAYGQFKGAGDPRIIQFALKFDW